MLNRYAYKVQKSYICVRKSANLNFCTARSPKSETLSSNVKNFYQDKNVLVTGATGFMGKALVEKLLRSCPGIKNVYVLVRPKTGIESEQRVRELANSQVFDRLKRENPKAINKLIGLNGNIETHGLGLSDSDLKKLTEYEPVVFHSAANISLQSFELNNFRKLAKANLGGTNNVLELCQKMPNCQNLIYISSVITNYDIPNEIKERVYPTKHTPQQVLEALENDKELKAITDKVKNLFPSSYAYTKRLAENLVLNEHKRLTVAIIRPSGVGASWREPMKGWVDTPTSLNAVAMMMAKGVLRVWHSRPETSIDVVPVDTANNCVISAAWYTSAYKPHIVSVFNYNTSGINLLKRHEFREMVLESSKKFPFNETFIYPNVRFAKSRIQFEVWTMLLHFLPALVADILFRVTGKKPIVMNIQRSIHMIYGSMPNVQFNYDNSALFEMWDTLSEEDKQEFWFDLRQIHWPDYIENLILGLKQYCFHEDLAGLPEARKNLQRKYKIYKLLQMTAITTVLGTTLGSIYLFV